MIDYEFDQSYDPSPRVRPMTERELTPAGQRVVVRQDDVDTALAEDVAEAAGDPTRTRRALLEAATAIEPTDAVRVQRLMDIAEPGVVAEHWGYVKAGLGQFVAIGKMPEVA